MLVKLKDILKTAQEKKIAIGAFNTPNLASIQAVVGAAEELSCPVIIMHAESHEELGVMNLEDIAPAMLSKAERASVPVCVHLDHGAHVEYVKRAIDLGFTGVMFDGSGLPLEENCQKTIEVVEYAAKKGISVEAEVGSMGGRDGVDDGSARIYTDPALAEEFVKRTGIDALACAFGTVHGFYKAEPRLDFERVEKIRSLVNVPIVMHGGSGVSPEDYRKAIRAGVRKINYFTYMSKAGCDAIAKAGLPKLYHEAFVLAREGMKQNAMEAMKIFAGIEG